MTGTKILGALLMASPFIGIAAWLVYEHGWLRMLAVYGACALLMGVIVLGVELWHR